MGGDSGPSTLMSHMDGPCRVPSLAILDLCHFISSTCIHAYMHTCIHAYMHTCIHAYMHTCIHVCTRACMRMLALHPSQAAVPALGRPLPAPPTQPPSLAHTSSVQRLIPRFLPPLPPTSLVSLAGVCGPPPAPPPPSPSPRPPHPFPPRGCLVHSPFVPCKPFGCVLHGACAACRLCRDG